MNWHMINPAIVQMPMTLNTMEEKGWCTRRLCSTKLQSNQIQTHNQQDTIDLYTMGHIKRQMFCFNGILLAYYLQYCICLAYSRWIIYSLLIYSKGYVCVLFYSLLPICHFCEPRFSLYSCMTWIGDFGSSRSFLACFLWLRFISSRQIYCFPQLLHRICKDCRVEIVSSRFVLAIVFYIILNVPFLFFSLSFMINRPLSHYLSQSLSNPGDCSRCVYRSWF